MYAARIKKLLMTLVHVIRLIILLMYGVLERGTVALLLQYTNMFFIAHYLPHSGHAMTMEYNSNSAIDCFPTEGDNISLGNLSANH